MICTRCGSEDDVKPLPYLEALCFACRLRDEREFDAMVAGARAAGEDSEDRMNHVETCGYCSRWLGKGPGTRAAELVKRCPTKGTNA